MHVAVLVSGGKDSALALHRALKVGHKVVCLVAMAPERGDSWMFHFVDVGLLRLFAEAAGFRLVVGETEGIKEEEVEDLKQVLAGLGVEGVVCGAVASGYQRDRVEGVCGELGLVLVCPLWGEDGVKLLGELVGLGFEVVVSRVAAFGLGVEWLGRRIDNEAIDELVGLSRRFGVSVVGEGGEYETLVLDAPFFREKRIELVEVERVWEEQSGYLRVKKARLVKK
jgi:diphthine-ammonia ligase